MTTYYEQHREGTCPHCRGLLNKTDNAEWNYVCTRCGRAWIIIDKIYWLAGFDAAGEIWKIKDRTQELIQDYNPLWSQLWDKYRESRK